MRILSNKRTIAGSSLILLMAIGIFSVSCAVPVPNQSASDCGFSAYYEVKNKDGKIEIVFSMITAEVLNGHTNCGFGSVRTKVDRAEIGGKALPERVEKDVYLYAAPRGFDPQKDPITIKSGNNTYVSDLATVRQTDNSVTIFLNPAR